MDEIESIASNMAVYAHYPEIQIIQTGFRKQIVDAWGIQPGAKILELGCGQGDLTAVLAYTVGPDGHITACDLAEPDYGAPITLGESTQYLLHSPLGSRITFHLPYDVLADENTFPDNSFDYVVFAHCSWYFETLDILKKTLTRIKPWAKRLCFAEWDLNPREPGQLAHALSVIIQGQVEAFLENSSANIRSPFTKNVIEELLIDTGWNEMSVASIDSSSLQDGQWEIEECIRTSTINAIENDLPTRFVDLIKTEVSLLQKLVEQHGNQSLSSFAILAERSNEY